MLKPLLAASALVIVAGCASQGGGGAAQSSNKALDPAYTTRLTEMRTQFQNLLTQLDADFDGKITEKEYCAVAGDDPLSPAYKKRQAEFKEMLSKMDSGKDGTLCLEEYMADANPLHPAHKR